MRTERCVEHTVFVMPFQYGCESKATVFYSIVDVNSEFIFLYTARDLYIFFCTEEKHGISFGALIIGEIAQFSVKIVSVGIQ